MNKRELLDLLECDGKLVSKRCTESFLSKHPNALQFLNDNVPKEFHTIGEKIRFIKYGGGFCAVCKVRTNIASSGQGFGKYCSEHFHEPKKGKVAHNRAEFDLSRAIELYEGGMAIIEAATAVGTTNTTLKKRMVEAGVILRSHSDNQKMRAPRGYTKPKKIEDVADIIRRYTIEKESARSISDDYPVSGDTIRRYLINNDVEMGNNRSYLETKVAKFLSKNNIDYVFGSKKVIPPQEIDFLIGNVGLELNGLRTHSRFSKISPKDRLYHYRKTVAAATVGIKLFHFWEPDIRDKFEIVSSIVLNALGKTPRRIPARKCRVEMVTQVAAFAFYEANHLQGVPGNNTISIGLFLEDELVSCIGYVVNANKTTVTRFCNILNTTVCGGFSKLLKRVPGSIIQTHSHNDISDGNLYKVNGFTQTNSNDADMWYTDYKYLLNRMGFAKNKLDKKLNTFDPGKTELENMLINGYDQIYKSGTKTWTLVR